MASPAGPRLGWSRRAQYGMFFGFLALIAGTVIGVVLLAISLVAPRTFDGIRGAALDVTAPITEALYEVRVTVTGVATGAGDYWNAASQNAQLKRDRKAMLRQIIQAKAVLQENRQLKAALRLRDEHREAIAVARVVFLVQQPRRSPFSRSDRRGVQIGIPCDPRLAVGRLSHRETACGCGDRLPRAVPGTAASQRHPGVAQGSGAASEFGPLEVGRNPFRAATHHHSGLGGCHALVPVPGREARGRRAIRFSPTRADQLRLGRPPCHPKR